MNEQKDAQNEEQKLELHMGIPNGVILTLIGILVLITPLFKEIPADKQLMNLIAGGVLTLGGLVSFVFGIRRSGKPPARGTERADAS